MSSLRKKLVSLINPDMAMVTIIYDSDQLLSDEIVISLLMEKGFKILLASSAVQLRFEFEEFLVKKPTNNLLILHQKESEYTIPSDIERYANIIRVSYDDLFPNLSASVLRFLNTNKLEDLYETYIEEDLQTSQSYDRTCLFVLRGLYKIHPQEIKTDTDLLQILLQIHFNEIDIPKELGSYFEKYMMSKERFSNWKNLAVFITDRNYFWNYLQKVWNNTIFNRNDILDGPSKLDFSKNNISVFMDDVFEKGLLKLTYVDSDAEVPDFISSSLFELCKKKESKELLLKERTSKLKKELFSDIPDENADINTWIKYQKLYSEYMSIAVSENNSELFEKANSAFKSWIIRRYDSMSFESGKTPIILPKVADYLKKNREETHSKIALIVMDGMSYSQWYAVKNKLSEQYVFEENTCFACIPTLTNVSRQAIFAGKYPRFFESSINTTSEEEKYWKATWDGIANAIYLKNNGRSKASDITDKITPSISAVGIVVNIVDDLMHGSILGNKDLYSRLNTWMEDYFMSDLMEFLLNQGFSVWITSDHGNIEAKGIGKINSGQLAETKGSRAFVFPSETLRNQFVAEKLHANAWNSKLLPDNYLVMTADNDYSFDKNDERSIVHGGISIDEVMVPFVKVMRNTK